jgi:hypothetical protein
VEVLLLIHISGVVSKENTIVALYRMSEWMDDGHGTQAPMTGDWSQRKKKITDTGRSICRGASILQKSPIMLHGAAFRCLSIRIGRSIQGKVPEIVVASRSGGTQTLVVFGHKAATVTSIKSWSSKLNDSDVWHVTMRTTVNATGTGSVTVSDGSHQPELLSVVLTIAVIDESPRAPSLQIIMVLQFDQINCSRS